MQKALNKQLGGSQVTSRNPCSSKQLLNSYPMSRGDGRTAKTEEDPAFRDSLPTIWEAVTRSLWWGPCRSAGV